MPWLSILLHAQPIVSPVSNCPNRLISTNNEAPNYVGLMF
jgi:hypothetical protein